MKAEAAKLEARQTGVARYLSDKSCKNGHVGMRWHYTCNGICQECDRIKQSVANPRDDGNKWARDIRGFRFGMLTAIDHIGHGLWNCVCSCGGFGVYSCGGLMIGKYISCGCQQHTGLREHNRTKTATRLMRSPEDTKKMVRLSGKKFYEAGIKNIDDWYVKHLLYRDNRSSRAIPHQLIEMKREQLRQRRLLRDFKLAITDQMEIENDT